MKSFEYHGKNIDCIKLLGLIATKYKLNHSDLVYTFTTNYYKYEDAYLSFYDSLNKFGITNKKITYILDTISKENNQNKYISYEFNVDILKNQYKYIPKEFIIDDYVLILEAPKYASNDFYKIYKIKYKTNGKIVQEYVDLDTIYRLTKYGYVLGYSINNNRLTRYNGVTGIPDAIKLYENKIYNIMKHNAIFHMTNETLSDKSSEKMQINELIFGEDELLKYVELSYKNETRTVSIKEFNNVKNYVVFAAKYNMNKRILDAEHAIIYDKEGEFNSKEDFERYRDYLKKNDYRVAVGNLRGMPKITVKISSRLNLKTANKFLKDKYKITTLVK